MESKKLLITSLIILITFHFYSCKSSKNNIWDDSNILNSNFKIIVYDHNDPILSLRNPSRLAISKDLNFKFLSHDDLFESISIQGYYKAFEPFTLKKHRELYKNEFSFECSEYFCNEFKVSENLSFTPSIVRLIIDMKGGKVFSVEISKESKSVDIC